MKKIIVTGHPQSGYEKVEALLLASGMAAARPSQRDAQTPQQITEILLKAHGAMPVQQVERDDPLPQLEVAPVWQGMVLDLMLSNLDQSLWGWADTQVVYLLNYWKAQDPQVVFALVYDHPSTALTRLEHEHAAASEEQLQQRLKAWVAYNSALLQFYMRNPQRCVLVHAAQVADSSKNYLQLINARIDSPLQLVSAVDQPELQTQAASSHQITTEQSQQVGEGLGKAWEAADKPDFANSQLARALLAQLLDTYPQAMALYEELQAAATLPHANTDTLAESSSTHSRFAAWQEYVKLYQCVFVEQKVAQDKANQIQHIQKELQSSQQQVLKLQQELAQVDKKKNAAPKELEEENQMLLEQLFKVQEELERYYLENQQLKAGGVVHQAKAVAKTSATHLYGAADRIKRQLSYRLGAVMIEQSRSWGGWLSMPFALREETKRFRQEQAARKGKKLPPISSYCDAYEAERVKQHLSYRLGSTLIEHAKSFTGWLTMPAALYAQVKQFRKSRR